MGGTPGIIGGIPVKLKHTAFVLYSTKLQTRWHFIWGFLVFDARPWNDPALTLISSVHPMCASHGRNPQLGHRCCIARLGLDGRALLCRWARFIVVVILLIRIVLIWLFLLTLWNQRQNVNPSGLPTKTERTFPLFRPFFFFFKRKTPNTHTALTSTCSYFNTPTLRFLLQCSPPVLHVLLWNPLHAIDLQLDVCSSRNCIWNTVNRLFVNLHMQIWAYINCPRHGGIIKQHVNKTRWINERERKATNLHAVNS